MLYRIAEGFLRNPRWLSVYPGYDAIVKRTTIFLREPNALKRLFARRFARRN
jgi:hypothetical protein